MDKKALKQQKEFLQKELKDLEKYINDYNAGKIHTGTGVIDHSIAQVRYETKNRMLELINSLL